MNISGTELLIEMPNTNESEIPLSNESNSSELNESFTTENVDSNFLEAQRIRIAEAQNAEVPIDIEEPQRPNYNARAAPIAFFSSFGDLLLSSIR